MMVFTFNVSVLRMERQRSKENADVTCNPHFMQENNKKVTCFNIAVVNTPINTSAVFFLLQ